jgi:hypothetical protein
MTKIKDLSFKVARANIATIRKSIFSNKNKIAKMLNHRMHTMVHKNLDAAYRSSEQLLKALEETEKSIDKQEKFEKEPPVCMAGSFNKDGSPIWGMYKRGSFVRACK